LIQENEDVLTELRSLHEKEKNLLMEENKKLSAELEKSLEVRQREPPNNSANAPTCILYRCAYQNVWCMM
jgi:hypothetical protein